MQMQSNKFHKLAYICLHKDMLQMSNSTWVQDGLSWKVKRANVRRFTVSNKDWQKTAFGGANGYMIYLLFNIQLLQLLQMGFYQHRRTPSHLSINMPARQPTTWGMYLYYKCVLFLPYSTAHFCTWCHFDLAASWNILTKLGCTVGFGSTVGVDLQWSTHICTASILMKTM